MSAQQKSMSSSALSLAIRIGITIRARRARLEWSQEELGFASGIHRTYIGEIERGNKSITVAKLVQLAEAMDCLPSDILKDCGL